MSYPNGVSLAVITAGTVSDFFGGDSGLTATATPVLRGTPYLVHAATGSVLVPNPVSFTAEPGEALAISVPHTNQDGWLDAAGNAFKGWAYEVTVTVRPPGAKKPVTWSKTLSPVIGQDLIDLDLIKSTGVGTPIIGQVPTVMSVVGKTGAITAQDLIAAGVGGTPAWDDVTGKPAAFPPDTHTHTTGQVTGLDARLNQMNVDISTAGAVKSVNGQTGAVVVDPTNVLSVDGYLRYRGELPAGSDLNAYKGKEHAGLWDMPASKGYANSPIADNMRGLLIVFAFGPGPCLQRVVQFSIASSFERTAVSFSSWSAWGTLPVANLPSGSDLDTLRANADWVIRNTADAQSMLGAWPEGVGRVVAHIQVRATSNGLAFQQMQTYGADPQLLIRSSSSVTGGPNFAWSAWKNLTKPPAPVQVMTEDHSALANTLLLQDFTRRRPVVKTGGKPAVALRYDHGLGNFRDKIVPTLKRLGLPAAICLNGGDWDRAENGGVTAAQVNTWVTEGWLEVWNHSLNHTVPPTDPAALETQIKGGLDKLRADLPAATIDGYMPPGGANDQTGFEGGKTIEAWWNTAPGRAILKHHAVTSGYLPGTVYRTLDGEVRQGLTHYGVDSADLATMKSRVTGAYSPVRGVNVMFHPSLIDTAGYATSADYTAFLEWLAGERDAGRVQVMGCYDLLRADARV